MKREIKFRAWDNKNKKWLCGYEYPNLGGFSMFGEIMAFGEWTRVLESFRMEEWDEIKPMQYTGLKDKNGKEIYEGDIMKDKTHGILFCEYEDEMQAFVWWKDRINGLGYPMYMQLGKNDIEVIGNIYENPELITDHD